MSGRLRRTTRRQERNGPLVTKLETIGGHLHKAIDDAVDLRRFWTVPGDELNVAMNELISALTAATSQMAATFGPARRQTRG